MYAKTHDRSLPLAFVSLTAASLLVSACSSINPSTGINSNAATGSSFVIATDAPLANVASFSAQVMSVELTGSGSTATASLITGTPTVDFARFNGLQTLLDMNSVPTGTYTGVSITLGAATIGYLDVPTSGAPTIATEAATYPSSATTYTFTGTLDKPLVVTTGGAPVGLRMDLNLQKTITVDSSGNITPAVTPTFNVNTIANTDSGGHIDELVAAVTTAPSGASEPNSFVVQGPHGEQFTINTTSTTEWDGDATLSGLTTSSIVLVSGQLDRATQTLDADEVAILSQTGFYASGLVTYVTPATGAASSFDLYVRGLLPANTGVQLGDIAQVDLSGSEKYSIYWMHNPFTQFLFSQSQLLPGQEVAIGGSASGVSATAPTVNAIDRVTLRDWGYIGTVVAGSQNSGKGSLQIQINGFAGAVIPQTLTVYLGGKTDFRYGCGGFGNLTNGATIRVVGLLLSDPTNGNAVLLARHIDGFNFNDFDSADWN